MYAIRSYYVGLTWFCWLLGAIILGNIDTAMYSIALAQGPQYMGWYSIITTVWNYRITSYNVCYTKLLR